MTRNLPLLPWHNRESSRNALSETWYGSFSAFTRQKIRLYPGSARTLLQNIITFWNNNWHNKWYLFTHTLQMYGKLTSSIVVECVHKSTSSIVGSGWHSLSAYREITILSTFSVVIVMHDYYHLGPCATIIKLYRVHILDVWYSPGDIIIIFGVPTLSILYANDLSWRTGPTKWNSD